MPHFRTCAKTLVFSPQEARIISFGTSQIARPSRARPSPRYRFPMDDAVLKLVDDVLANAPAALREACSCRGILAGLETAGAFDVRTLRTLLEQDY